MTPNQIKQITVKGQLVGITGWSEALKKIASADKVMTDEDIKQALLGELSSKNYIPSGALNDYGRALLREFKIEQDLPVEEEPILGLRIAVLGMSCANCTRLETDVRDLLAEMNIAADLRHITDPKQIASYGVMGTPALVMNNKVVSVGEVPPKSKIRQFIIDAYPTPDK
jgi:hypothetical protein